MTLNVVQSSAAPTPTGGYTQALEVTGATRLLFVSGQIPETPDGTVPDAFTDQARLVWRNVIAQLEAADMTVRNLVKVTTYLSSRAYADANASARREALGTYTPALTVLIAGIFDERWLLEIEAVAAA